MKELFAALSKAQSKFQPIKKDQKGYNYKYADINAILEMIRPVLCEYGLMIVQMPIEKNGELQLRTLIGHESGEKISFCTPIMLENSKGMNRAQSFGSAVSYTRRYSLVSALGLEMEDDDGKASAALNTPQKQPISKPGLISEPQRKRLFALSKGLEESKIKDVLAKEGFESSKDISIEKYDKICQKLQNLSELKKASQPATDS